MVHKRRRGAIEVGGAEEIKRKFVEEEELPPATVRALDQIKPRAWGDTRQLDPGHVVALAESIAALGLLEPLVIDRDDRLLAGAHRLAALKVLAAGEGAQAAMLIKLFSERDEELPKELTDRAGDLDGAEIDVEKIPVRPMDFSSGDEPNRALAIETSENEKRRDYTREEVREIYETLKARGFTDRRGRPAKGEKPVKPAIAAIIGKSLRTVERLIRPKAPKRSKPKNPTPVGFNQPAVKRDPIPEGEAEQLPLGAPARSVEWDEGSADVDVEPPSLEEVPFKAQDEAPNSEAHDRAAFLAAARAYHTRHWKTADEGLVDAARYVIERCDALEREED